MHRRHRSDRERASGAGHDHSGGRGGRRDRDAGRGGGGRAQGSSGARHLRSRSGPRGSGGRERNRSRSVRKSGGQGGREREDQDRDRSRAEGDLAGDRGGARGGGRRGSASGGDGADRDAGAGAGRQIGDGPLKAGTNIYLKEQEARPEGRDEGGRGDLSATAASASQTRAAAAQPDAGADAAGTLSANIPLEVSGCSDKVVGEFITGIYVPSSTNHGKVVYRKETKTKGHDTLIYYWDERDGPEQCGWWFGPSIGGNQVWAYHPSRAAATPPPSEWNVPHDGAIDPKFAVKPVESGAKPPSSTSSRRPPRAETSASSTAGAGEGTNAGTSAGTNEAGGIGADANARSVGSMHAEPPKTSAAASVRAKFVDAYNKRLKEVEEAKRKQAEEAAGKASTGTAEKREPEEERKAHADAEDAKRHKGEEDDERRRRDEEKQRLRDEEDKRRADDDATRQREDDDRKKRREDDERRKRGDDDRSRRKPDDGKRRREDEGGDRRRQEDRRRDEDRKPEEDRRREEDRGKDKDRRKDEERLKHEDRRKDDERRKDEERRRDERRREEERQREEERRRDEERRSRANEQDRHKLEDEKRKKEEEMQKREEELQRKRDEKRREEEDKVRVDQEKRMEEDRVRREELRAKLEEEAAKQAEVDRLRMEEENARQDEAAKAARMQEATLVVLKVLQQLSTATPENFESLKAELAGVMDTELPRTGTQHDILKGEADRVLRYAQEYVEKIRQEQAQEKERLAAQEQASRSAMEELEQLVAAAEARAESANIAAALLAGGNDMEDVALLEAANTVELLSRKSIESCSKSGDFLGQKRAIIQAADHLIEETSVVLSKAAPRICAAMRSTTEAVKHARATKEIVMKTMASKKRLDVKAVVFARYDKDGDGLLSLDEIAEYTRGEFNFELSLAKLDLIRRRVCRGSSGVPQQDLHLLKSAVGIAREEVAGRTRQAKREAQQRIENERAAERRKLVDDKKTEASSTAGSLVALVDEKILPALSAAESQVQSLASDGGALGASALQTAASSLELAASAADAEVNDFKRRFDGLCKDIHEFDELVELLQAELEELSKLSSACEERLASVAGASKRAAGAVLYKQLTEYDDDRLEVAAALRAAVEAAGTSLESIFDAVSGSEGDSLSVEAVGDFLARHGCEVPQDKLVGICARCTKDTIAASAYADSTLSTPGSRDGGDCDATASDNAIGGSKEDVSATPVCITKDAFARLVRVYYKVAKAIVLSDSLSIGTSGQLRRLDEGEVVEVIQGPMLESTVGVHRVNVRALRDNLLGWVTVKGNQGVVFLLPGGSTFWVTQPTALSADLRDLDGATTVKTLQCGDIIQVLDWAKTSKSSLGVTRIKARVQGCGSIGWATIADNDGNVYLVPT